MWQASEGEGNGKDERVKCEKIGRGRIVVGDTSLSRAHFDFPPFYGLPRRLSDQQICALNIIGQSIDINNIITWLHVCIFLQCEPFVIK